jgi:CRP/FNR family transcriptional regulator, cyclic AMP receptor protein
MSDLEDLDFTRPAKSEIYDPAVARSCFEALGTAENLPQGKAFFVEGQGSDRMYLLVEGEVTLLRGKKTIDIVKAGEIFGEMATITQQPRSASALARHACRALSLDTRQFQRAIQRTPEFALMLMSIMVNRLRLTVAMLGMTKSIPDWGGKDASALFDRKLLDEWVAALPERPPQRCPAAQVITSEGEAGIFMYLVLQGRVAISIKGTVVERIGPGGMFGEMALVDQSPRAATATAETGCLFLTINRNDFLSLVKGNPAFAVSLLRAVAERLRHMTTAQR